MRVLLFAAVALAADPYAARRAEMVRVQIQARDIRHPRVLDALRSVPRHLFVPPALRFQAYEDHPVPIGHDQTISQPYIVAFMTEALAPEKNHTVLEIGTGSGYQAAVLSPLVREVATIEIVPALAASAKALLAQLEYRNVVVREGNGYLGWPEKAPFDRIILTAAPREIPQRLLDQLKPGGRLIGPAGATVLSQELVVIDKDVSGKLRRRAVLPVRFVPMVRPEGD
ncbi:MAG: protein-L-isoaspartate(D-aspartate) O-methyltransferase [Bryobacteraceae bacterium]